MTGQSTDTLIVRGKRLDLLARPLQESRKWRRRAARIPIAEVSSANRDGYTCTWEIRDSKLWLIGMEGVTSKDGERQPLSLDHLVPPEQQPLLADWVSDILYATDGALIAGGFNGFMRKCERDHIFEIAKGELVDEVLRINPPPPIAYSVSADGRRRLLGRDPYIHHGFKDMDFNGFRYLLEPDTPWGEETGFYAGLDDLFPPEEEPTGGPFWAMQAELYRRVERRDRDEAEEWDRMHRERALREARTG